MAMSASSVPVLSTLVPPSSVMRSRRQLVHATLAELGTLLMDRQMELRMVVDDGLDMEEELMACEDYADQVRREIKAIKGKIAWEQRQAVRLGMVPPHSLPPPSPLRPLSEPPDWEDDRDGEPA